ncbi:MAG: TatD family hydrolase [Atopobiaceae bacterium]|jgi:TatD DNase family protein
MAEQNLLDPEALFYDKRARLHMPAQPYAPLFDTHTHLTQIRDLDPAVAVARAALAGVRYMVCPVDPTDDAQDPSQVEAFFDEVCDRARALLREVSGTGTQAGADHALLPPEFLCDHIYIIAGIHPYGAQEINERMGVLNKLLESPRCVGVGEIGLDLGPYNELDLTTQLEAFEIQLRLAHERNVPVELHIRDAKDDASATAHRAAFDLLERQAPDPSLIDLHCFTQGPEVMRPFAQMGTYIAFGGAATFKKSDDIRQALAACPKDQILLETDSPYMAPHPLRGLSCEPAMVAFTAELIAKTRAQVGDEPSKTYKQLLQNALAFLRLPAPA